MSEHIRDHPDEAPIATATRVPPETPDGDSDDRGAVEKVDTAPIATTTREA